MHGRILGLTRLLGAGLMIGSVGCGDAGGAKDDDKPDSPDIPLAQAVASLSQAVDCGDLLTKVQDDAIAKVKLAAEQARTQGSPDAKKSSGAKRDAGRGVNAPPPSAGPVPAMGGDEASDDDDTGAQAPSASAPTPGTGNAASSAGEAERPTEGGGSTGTSKPVVPGLSDQDAQEESANPSGVSGPTGASGTNKQVANVDEADFVKVVNSGAGMFLLHGSTLQKLKTFPAAQTALEGTPLTIEGTPSEMFVTDQGRAVVFSSVYRAQEQTNASDDDYGGDYACSSFGPCGPSGNALKVTIANVAANPPTVERELYYTGSYVSARRYAFEASDVVRVIVQSNSSYYGLYQPDIMWQDAWGRAFDDATIAAQLAEWEQRQTAAIRNTTLEDWLPRAYERVGGKDVEVARQCESYYVPAAGLTEHGLTQVLSLDIAQLAAPVGGITIVGASSTVYSNAQKLVLAQPDYRFNEGGADFGIISEERTALHVFDLAGAATGYLASGWVSGHLPPHNPQFGIDVAADGTLRVATTGLVRSNPAAKPEDPDFWNTDTETRVITARAEGNLLKELGRTANLGLPRERIQSARFVGDRAYVVTFEQTDPLVVVDVTNPVQPVELGQIKIPGFSQYMHPLDANHIITVGMSAQRGIQLQLFDVTNPMSIPPPKVHDFGSGSSSEASYQHKAFTFYNGVLALPVSGSYPSADFRRSYYSSALQLLRVDAVNGFSPLGTVDHSRLYAQNDCGVCDELGCYDYRCGYGYAPEVRRGVFVSAESSTYVYSFSHAGVLVHDLASLAAPLATVTLPAPVYDVSGGGGATKPSAGSRDAGRAVTPVAPDQPVPNTMPVPAVDAGSSIPTQDAGAPSDLPTSLADAATIAVDAGVPAAP